MISKTGNGVAVALCAWLLAVGQAGAQARAERVAGLEERLAAARDAAVHVLAPEAFDRAADRVRDVVARAARNAGDESLARRIADAESALDQAAASAERAAPRYGPALEARGRAVDEGASQRAGAAWEAAEQEMRRAGERAERGDPNGGSEHAARAAELYVRAARAARRERLLGAAVQARQAALAVGGSELARVSFAAGEAALARGEAALAADDPDSAVGSAGASAETAFARAARIASLADSVQRRTVPVERLLDAHDADLAALIRVAGLADPGFRDGPDRARDALARWIETALSERARLERELAAERETTRQLNERVDRLEEDLAESERRYSSARGDLLAREQREARLREAEALFGPDEGVVLLSGNLLVIRLHGLAFESGSSDVDEALTPLLTKVQRVIMEFSGASIRIEGHTDSRGSDEANKALSQRRALAIREHLLTRLPISASRIEAVGIGEDRPIATNDTEEGRARNRRIEIMLTLSG